MVSNNRSNWQGRLTALVATVAGCAVLLLPAAASALPAGRHYEMVSQPFKAGYAATPEALAANGDCAVYFSLGAFAGAPTDSLGPGAGNSYLACRTGSGWSTTSLVLPASIAPYSPPGTIPGFSDISADFKQSLFYGQMGTNAGAAEEAETEAGLFLHPIGLPDTAPLAPEPGPNFQVAGEIFHITGIFLSYLGASPDLSHLIVEPTLGFDLTSEAEGTSALMKEDYDLLSGGGEHWLRMIGVNNQPAPRAIDPNCARAAIGAEANGGTKFSTVNAVADDGRIIFFWTCISAASNQVFVRLNGERTLEVSRPLEAGEFGGCVGEASPHTPGEVPCEGAATRGETEFVGASQDGSKVFYMTGDVGFAKTQKDDLYMATIGCPSSEPGCETAKREVTQLVRISRPIDVAEAAEVQGAIASSADGSRVYFVAHGILSGENAEKRAPIAGADNMYVYDGESQSTTFIADLCSGGGMSGEAGDFACPATLNGTGFSTDEELWGSKEPEAQLAGPNGDVLVFTSYGQLTGDDVNDTRDVYRYDASAGRLERVSVGEDGFGANGNDEEAGGGGAQISKSTVSEPLAVQEDHLGGHAPRVVSEDGSRIVFTSGRPLSPDATNGLVNAYEWREGEVSLLSSGNDAQPVELAMTTPSGDDVIFKTVAKLLPQDTDEQPDVYDARLGEGFPPGSASARECGSDACQGALTTPAPLLVPGSAAQAAGENLAPPSRPIVKRKAKPKRKLSRRRHRHRRRTARGSARRHTKPATKGRGR